MKTLIVLAVLLAASAASAETVTGQITDPGLRRKTQLVYLETVPGKFPPPAQPVLVNQKGNTYLPHLIPVLAGTKVVFKSADPELHNVYARENKVTLFNRAVLPNQQFERTFDEVGVVHLACNVHREMSADIIVLQNPFFALPDKAGTFTIEGVPAGSYTLRVWGEAMSDEQKAKKTPVTAGGAQAPLKLASK